MTESDGLDFFFGNLLRLLGEAGLTKRRLSISIGKPPGFLDGLFQNRTPPDLLVVYGIAGVLKVDVADLLRPGPRFGLTSNGVRNYWAERTAEEYLQAALNRSREAASFEAPTFDALLNWWHANSGRLVDLDRISNYIELFEPPDAADLRPIPFKLGRESLAARELGLSRPEHLQEIFDQSEPDVARSVALAHLEVAGGQPKLSCHTILANMMNCNVVEMIYNRLLLPVKDGDGRTYVLNYSKPVRRSEISREHVHEFQSRHRGKPVFASLI